MAASRSIATFASRRGRVAAPFVLCEGKSNSALGYYTLSALRVDVGAWPEDVAKKVPRYPLVPATLLGRLAVDTRLRGKGAAECLLISFADHANKLFLPMAVIERLFAPSP